jgi:hypothetical protein
MSNVQKNSVNVLPVNDVLSKVARTVRAAERRHSPIVNRSDTALPCSSFSSSCSEIVYARNSPRGGDSHRLLLGLLFRGHEAPLKTRCR